MSKEYLKIIKEEGEFDFEVSAMIMELSQLEYEELKSMLIIAIGNMEELRRYGLRNKEKELEIATYNECMEDTQY